MHDRLSSFSDPKIIKLIRENFIPATGNDWFNRRRQDAVGKFFIHIADQGPRTADGTRQGHYIFTAGGKLLGYNNNRTIDRRLKFINEAIEQWNALPEGEKMPGAIDVPELKASELDEKYHADLPEGAIALIASERILKVGAGGKLAICGSEDHDHSWGHLAAIDRMWIKEEEWQQLVEPIEFGESQPVNDRLAKRLVRYHLLDFTRGEPVQWKLDDIQSLKLIKTRTGKFTFDLSGTVLVSDSERGFEASVLGKVEYNPATEKISQFDLVVLGEHWGDGKYTKGARPGRSPLGIAFRLGDPAVPEDRIRPQGSHHLPSYWAAENP